MNAMPGSERKELAGFAGLEGARLDLSALEAQKDKYAVLAQLQPLAVSLASGDPVAGQRACMVVASLAAEQATREAMLSHPVCEVVLLRCMDLVQADTKELAAAACKALKSLSGDAEARRRLIYPRQSSLMGPRSAEDVVRCMLAGLAVLLHSPDDELVRDAAATLRNLMCSPGIWDRLCQQSETMFNELLFGLVRAMMLQGYNQQFMLVSAGAAEALNAICGQVALRERIISTPKALETLLYKLNAALNCERAGDAAAVVCSLLGGEEANAFQAIRAQSAVLTRHPDLGHLLKSLTGIMRTAVEPHAIINAHRSLHLLIRNEDLPTCLLRIDDGAACRLLLMLSHLLLENDPKVTLDTAVAMQRVIKGAYTLVLSQTQEFFQNLVRGWTRLLGEADNDASFAAAAGVCALAAKEEGQAVLVMWPDSEAMHSLLGTLVGCIGGSRPPNLEAKAAATTAALFRGTQGETFMRRLVRPPELDDIPLPESGANTGIWGWFMQPKAAPPDEAFKLRASALLGASVQVLYLLLARTAYALNHDDLDVAGPASEVFCCWAAVEPAWEMVMSSPDVQSVSKVLSGLVKMIGRAMPAVVTRNAVVGIHGFTVEEKGRMYLRSQNLQLIRAMLGGLLLHSQSQHTTNNHPDDGHVLTAQIANGCLRNLRDSGEECWPRWINGLTLPREYEMSAVEV
mmetsp:Transcript_21585/g.41182  ORF Transcript_21585/g.41182 Transcript_21585/m.41182 type:complete len:687 (-) Transcript_21585:146-2206(-)